MAKRFIALVPDDASFAATFLFQRLPLFSVQLFHSLSLTSFSQPHQDCANKTCNSTKTYRGVIYTYHPAAPGSNPIHTSPTVLLLTLSGLNQKTLQCNKTCRGGHHSSLDPSVPNLLWPRVRIPSTPTMLLH